MRAEFLQEWHGDNLSRVHWGACVKNRFIEPDSRPSEPKFEGCSFPITLPGNFLHINYEYLGKMV